MTTISVRVPDDLKQQTDDLGLNKSEIMRSALADEVRRYRRERMAERREQISALDVDLSNEEIATAVRKSRDEDAQ
jgi:post-segregation antitoxin (ccd killing protein)